MPDRRLPRSRPLRLSATIAVTLLLGACGQSSERTTSTTTSAPPRAARPPLPTAIQELEIDATEYAFTITPDISGGVKPGWTKVTFHNVGVEPHQVMFAHIKDGVDMAELAAAGANDSSGAGAIEYVDMVGGVSYIGAGQDTTAMVDLSEGLVMAMCYVPDAKGVAHALMGMTTALTVTAPTGGSTNTQQEPSPEQVVGSIELAKDGYHLPDDIGPGWYHVRNTDKALHEVSMLRLSGPLDESRAADLIDALAANETPKVKLEAVGGMGAISPGFDGYLYLDLQPGNYLAVDFMPDPGEPRPHMLDGYYAQFTV